MSLSINASISNVCSIGITIKTVIDNNDTKERAVLKITARNNAARQWKYEFRSFEGDQYLLDTDEWLIMTDKLLDRMDPENIFEISRLISKITTEGRCYPKAAA